jgi:Protein of unknown function (DUF3293)
MPITDLRGTWLRTKILIRVGGRTVDIDDVPTGSFARAVAPLGLPLTVVTAWNPTGNPRSREANRLDNLRLRRQLVAAGLANEFAIGRASDGSWAEPGFAVNGLDERQAMELGQQWKQLAVFFVTETEVVVLASDGSTRDSRARPRRP